MNLLLDTHVVLWWLGDAPELSARARSLLGDPSSVLFLSAASVWEMRIKQSLGKLRLPSNFATVLAGQAIEPLPITHAHAHRIEKLPPIHRDPFDRLLIAQAECEGLTIVTRDQVFGRYASPVELV